MVLGKTSEYTQSACRTSIFLWTHHQSIIANSILKQLILGNDIRGHIEIANVWEDSRHLRLINTQPLSNGNKHAFPGVLGDQSCTPSILVVTLKKRRGEVIEHASTSEVASQD